MPTVRAASVRPRRPRRAAPQRQTCPSLSLLLASAWGASLLWATRATRPAVGPFITPPPPETEPFSLLSTTWQVTPQRARALRTIVDGMQCWDDLQEPHPCLAAQARLHALPPDTEVLDREDDFSAPHLQRSEPWRAADEMLALAVARQGPVAVQVAGADYELVLPADAGAPEGPWALSLRRWKKFRDGSWLEHLALARSLACLEGRHARGDAVDVLLDASYEITCRADQVHFLRAFFPAFFRRDLVQEDFTPCRGLWRRDFDRLMGGQTLTHDLSDPCEVLEQQLKMRVYSLTRDDPERAESAVASWDEAVVRAFPRRADVAPLRRPPPAAHQEL